MIEYSSEETLRIFLKVKAMKNLPELNTLLQYKNSAVIKRFQKKYPDFHNTAERIFLDMLRFLWLCQKHKEDTLKKNPESEGFHCEMHKEMIMIDEMWHTFILATKDYAQFCDDYFGTFIHHVP